MSLEVNGVKLSDVTVDYLSTIMWAETVLLPVPEEELVNDCMDVDEGHVLHGVSEHDSLEVSFSLDDFTVESLEGAEDDCIKFFDRANTAGLIERAHRFGDDAQIARDFCLTRQGHGVGFWDGDYEDDTDDVGSPLSELAAEFGECYVCIGDDCRLHIG